jgi:hypothetical protein
MAFSFYPTLPLTIVLGSNLILGVTKTPILMGEFVWSGIVSGVRTFWMTGERFYISNLALEGVKIS